MSETAEAFFHQTRIDPVGFDYEIRGDVPPARGLGSSATIRAGIVAGLNALTGDHLDQEAMIRLTAKMEGSPDNVCACFVGGFCLARTDLDGFDYRGHLRFELPETLVFVVVSPDYEVLTDEARLVLPDKIAFNEVVGSINSLAFFMGTMLTGDFEHLNEPLHDYIHQPYREKLNPGALESIQAGCDGGAYTGWLSGSGSSVLCLTNARKAAAVEVAMQEVYEKRGIRFRTFRLEADNQGLTLI